LPDIGFNDLWQQLVKRGVGSGNPQLSGGDFD